MIPDRPLMMARLGRAKDFLSCSSLPSSGSRTYRQSRSTPSNGTAGSPAGGFFSDPSIDRDSPLFPTARRLFQRCRLFLSRTAYGHFDVSSGILTGPGWTPMPKLRNFAAGTHSALCRSMKRNFPKRRPFLPGLSGLAERDCFTEMSRARSKRIKRRDDPIQVFRLKTFSRCTLTE